MSANPVDTTTTDATAGRRTSVDVRRFSWVRPLAGDYAFDFPRFAELYSGDPAAPHAWQDAIRRARHHPRKREDIAAVLAAQQARRGAPPAALEAAARLADPSTVAVVTGQQAGAFGGPLFTLLKAVSAIQLARRTAALHETAAVAVFWVDAEDHDWDEVASCTVLDGGFQPRTIMLAPPGGAGERPVADLELDGRVEESLAELEAALGGTDFTEWVITGLRQAYSPGAGMADAFAVWLESLLGPCGLVVFDSADPAAKPLVAPVFTRELETPGRTAALAAEAGDALAALGHSPQVVPQPDSVALHHIDGARLPIRRQEGTYIVGDRSYAIDALAREAASHPERFSPNVLLRPIVQDTLFPTICYVGGPSELAYLGQLRGVYEHFGVPMPLVFPRATATLVDSATARFLAKHDLPLEALQPQDESALNRLLQAQIPPSLEQAMKDAEQAVRRSMERVVDAMPALDPTLAGAAKTTLGKIEHELRGLQNKMIHAAKRRDETLRRQFVRAQAQALPQGHPQERTLAVVYFLNKYGPALVDRLLDELPLDLGRHWILTI